MPKEILQITFWTRPANLGELPDWARGYFDFKAYARDLEMSGDYSFVRAIGRASLFLAAS